MTKKRVTSVGSGTDSWAAETCSRAAEWAHDNVRFLNTRWQADKWHEAVLPSQFNNPNHEPRWRDFVPELNAEESTPDSNNFWTVLEPFAKHLIAKPSVRWIGVALRFGFEGESGLRFNYWCEERLVRPASGEGVSDTWRRHELAGVAKKRGWKMLLTSDLGLNEIGDGTLVVFDASEGAVSSATALNVSEIVARLRGDGAGLMMSCLAAMTKSDPSWEWDGPRADDQAHADFMTKEVPRLLAGVGESGIAEKIRSLDRTGESLVNYLALMTYLVEDWQRIVMIPHRGVTSTDGQSGGILVCESREQGELLDMDELAKIAAVANTVMWPWQQSREHHLAVRTVARRLHQIMRESVVGIADLVADIDGITDEVRSTIAFGVAEASQYVESLVSRYYSNRVPLATILANKVEQLEQADFLELDFSYSIEGNPRVASTMIFVVNTLVRNAIKHNGDWFFKPREKKRLRIAAEESDGSFTITVASPANVVGPELQRRVEELKAYADPDDDSHLDGSSPADLVLVAESLYGTPWTLEYDGVDDPDEPWIVAVLKKRSLRYNLEG